MRRRHRQSPATERSRPHQALSPATTQSAAAAERIRRAAIALFHERGYHGTTMRSLGARLRVEAPSIYYHFPSKQDILFDILDRSMDHLQAGLEPTVAAQGDPVARLRAGLRYHVLHMTSHGDEAFLNQSELRSLTPANLRRIIAKRDRYEQVFRDILAAGAKAGAFAVSDTRLAAIAILTMCTQVPAWFSEQGRLRADAIADSYIEMILRGVGAAAAAAGSPVKARPPRSRKKIRASLR